ncbi:hypothetical protein J7J84_08190 [bacterium]|nr:hypothetical protein [bacterium]
MGKQELSRVFSELLRHLGGSRSPVFLRTRQLSGGLPAAGEPPSGPYEDTELVPMPLVLDAGNNRGEGLREVIANHRERVGLKKLVLHGSNPVEIGSRLFFEGAEWEVVRMQSPLVFGLEPLKLVLARRLIT